MSRYIDADALDLMHIDQTDLPQNGCLSVVLFEDVCNAPTADVVEVTDKSMIPIVKDFEKDLEKLGGRATCADIIKSIKK